MIKKWKFVSRNILLRHPRLEISEDTVELPSGKITSYVRESPVNYGSVTAIVLNDKKEILVQQEYSYPPDEIMYQLPGGKMNSNEDIIDAINRELSEESGIVAIECTVIGSYYVNNRRSDAKQYVVLCKSVEIKKRKEDDEEFIESQWIPLSLLDGMIKDGEIVNINMLAALQLYNSYKKL